LSPANLFAGLYLCGNGNAASGDKCIAFFSKHEKIEEVGVG